ncbi:hypothetical protein JTP64_000184 [Candida tropicalis]|nr:hypothetical protein JTP64_000184 [Candida tropicalis]
MRLNNLFSIIAIFAAFVNALSYPEILYGNPRLQARDKVTVPSDPIERTSVRDGHATITNDTSATISRNYTSSSSSSISSVNNSYQFQIPSLLIIATILLSWL